MATIAFAAGFPQRISPSLTAVQWGALTFAGLDDGAVYDWVEGAANLFVQVTGTLGVGGSITFEGSLDGTTFFALTQADGATAATFTALGGAAINGTPRFIRARVTAGDGTTSLTPRVSFQRALRA